MTDIKQELSEKMRYYNRNLLIWPAFKRGSDLLWVRGVTDQARNSFPDTFHTNVRWRVIEHSHDGYEIGYPGSGPADLALNICAAIWPISASTKEISKCYYGRVSVLAYLAHQRFNSNSSAMLMNKEAKSYGPISRSGWSRSSANSPIAAGSMDGQNPAKTTRWIEWTMSSIR